MGCFPQTLEILGTGSLLAFIEKGALYIGLRLSITFWLPRDDILHAEEINPGRSPVGAGDLPLGKRPQRLRYRELEMLELAPLLLM